MVVPLNAISQKKIPAEAGIFSVWWNAVLSRR